jgi:hypothetical protein
MIDQLAATWPFDAMTYSTWWARDPFYIDPDGTVGILLIQAEMGKRVGERAEESQALPPPS